MPTKVASISKDFCPDEPASWIINIWDRFHQQRRGKIDEWKELRNYLFATDTSTTSNSVLPWKNKTTIPKLCQIRDNLHSNYVSALFPNDDWMQWIAYTQEDATKAKADIVKAYLSNKTREGHFNEEISRLLYDYIDYGNAFATVTYETNVHEIDGEVIPQYIGPRVYRISPMDIVFNPLASSFKESFKVIRSVRTLGDLAKLSKTDPSQRFWEKALQRRNSMRKMCNGYSKDDFDKYEGFTADGFGNLYEYYMSDYVEVLEFYGDWYDTTNGVLHENTHMVVVDRMETVHQEPIPNWFGAAPIFHVGWRFRTDNLWAMGPLDNLVGMQYRIDHLENLKADAMDLCVHPPLLIRGDVEEFNWGPNEEIHVDDQGDVQELGKNLNGIIQSNNEIDLLEQRMEMYAGAPREAMGIRSPGEKTAFEVQQLQNAGGRIFQEKINQFEIELLEPVLNSMLETSRRNLDGMDVLRVMDDDSGAVMFKSITKQDITASGKIRPVGARHFAKQAQDLQNLVGVFSSPMASMLAPHTSGQNLAKFLDDNLGVKAYKIFSPNVAVSEQQETARLASQSQEDLAMEQAVPAQGQY